MPSTDDVLGLWLIVCAVPLIRWGIRLLAWFVVLAVSRNQARKDGTTVKSLSVSSHHGITTEFSEPFRRPDSE